MAGWSILTNGYASDCLEILQNLQNNGFCHDLDLNSFKMSNDGGGGGKDIKLRGMFYRILSVFLKEISVNESIWPLPPMLGDGKCVDLFKLFWVVREQDGYDSVTKLGIWGLVAEEIGLSSGVASSVKLFYFKYLDVLDRWVQRFFKDKSKGRSKRNLGLLPVGLETQISDFLCNVSDKSRLKEGCDKLDSKENENKVSSPGGVGSVEKCVVDDDEDVVMLDGSVAKQEPFSRKRKRATFSGMLNWVTEIAKNPSDDAIWKVAEAFKQREYGDKECCNLVLLARSALLHKRNWAEVKDIWQKREMMHPDMYEDQVDVDHLSMERLKCSPRILSPKNSQPVPNHESSDMETSAVLPAGTENGQSQSLNPFDDGQLRKRVSIGLLYQAEIPEWTGTTSKSDPKWLGTITWPKAGKQNSAAERIGKGRQDSCNCRVPGSLECVGFHIAENKVKLKSELGLVFYTWRFHYMGEEVSLSWTESEQKKFKATVRLNPPSQGKCFWTPLCRCLRTKSWRSLVSYYYNVFVLRRRTYQNRVTPSKIDSDDDESEFGSLSNGFGHAAVNVWGSGLIACSQNSQQTNLDLQTC